MFAFMGIPAWQVTAIGGTCWLQIYKKKQDMTPCADIYLCVRRFFRSTFFVEKQKKRTFARRLLSKGPFWSPWRV